MPTVERCLRSGEWIINGHLLTQERRRWKVRPRDSWEVLDFGSFRAAREWARSR